MIFHSLLMLFGVGSHITCGVDEIHTRFPEKPGKIVKISAVAREVLRSAQPAERRYTFLRVHHATAPQTNTWAPQTELALIHMLVSKTPAEMHKLLAVQEVGVTNVGDRDRMLPILLQTDERVQERMRMKVA